LQTLLYSILPRGERHRLYHMDCMDGIFQSTLPRGERLEFVFVCVEFYNFNPRSRVGSDLQRTSCDTSCSVFQSTLPRGERRDEYIAIFGEPEISIHAPAWGATTRVYDHFPWMSISIHAPAWGATSMRFHSFMDV